MATGFDRLRKRRRGRCTGMTFLNQLGTSIAYDVCWVGGEMMELEVTVYRDDPHDAEAETRKSFVIYGTQRNFAELGDLLLQVSRYRPGP